MAELLQTERAYVKDLETCITGYLREMRTDPSSVPPALQGKVKRFLYYFIFSLILVYGSWNRIIYRLQGTQLNTSIDSAAHINTLVPKNARLSHVICRNSR